jgi:hypothetical protein
MKKTLIGTLDRFENGTGILLVGEDAVTMAKGLLPEGVKEGDMISIKLELKDRKTKEEKEKVDRLIKKLSSGSGE